MTGSAFSNGVNSASDNPGSVSAGVPYGSTK